mgnify:CR=1 FL=1
MKTSGPALSALHDHRPGCRSGTARASGRAHEGDAPSSNAESAERMALELAAPLHTDHPRGALKTGRRLSCNAMTQLENGSNGPRFIKLQHLSIVSIESSNLVF